MEASRHLMPGSPAAFAAGGLSVASAGRTTSQDRSGAGGGEPSAIGGLIERADALHLRAPELALVLGERAAALAETAGSDEQWVRAEGLVVSARVRLGQRPGTVARAVAALRAAEHAGYADVAARLRVDLAVCARGLGVPLTGLAALRPVLADPGVSPVHRAAALCHLVGCLAQIGRKAELDRVLVAADKLVLGDEGLAADTQLLVRALLRVGTAAHRRRHGDLTAAADAARTGLGLLEKLDNPADDGGLVRVRLVLQLVSTLLDRGDTAMAYEIAQPVLAEPVRAGGVAPMGWLRLAVATRVHLPAGAGEAAAELVREAVASTDRHGLASVTARLWLELAQIEERFGHAEDAIACLHRSRAAEHVHARARRQACGLLAGAFGTGELASVDLDEVVNPSGARPGPVGPPTVVVEAPARRPEPEVPARPGRAPVSWAPEPRAEPVVEPVLERAARPEPVSPSPAGAGAPEREGRGGRRRADERRAEPAPMVQEVAKATEAVAVPAPGEVAERPREGRRRRAEEPVATEHAGHATPPVAPEPPKTEPPKLEPPKLEPSKAPLLPEVTDLPPELPLAPAPAEEPAPRAVPAKAERAPEAEAPRWDVGDWSREGERREPPPPARSTRHDAEHGSVTARSVLDRLGISGANGHGGGRRRAADGPEPARPAERGIDESPAGEPRPEPIAAPGPASSGTWESELAPPPRPEEPAPSVIPEPGPVPSGAAPVREERVREEVADPWLPRLRMPPSLDPAEDFGGWTPGTEAFPEGYAKAIAEDEPPPDAGLADLLARALAEHQAGTASAAALVKRLGAQGENTAGHRSVNGHGRNGSDDSGS
ncbi:hypothetical protein [Amycolatopsis samaneae]|uniref:Uncharacterized protein n=1 Tax=Amycolatopsis samaneae TaxID=664691 RepID=A0ABW5GTP0_9PSEU